MDSKLTRVITSYTKWNWSSIGSGKLSKSKYHRQSNKTTSISGQRYKLKWTSSTNNKKVIKAVPTNVIYPTSFILFSDEVLFSSQSIYFQVRTYLLKQIYLMRPLVSCYWWFHLYLSWRHWFSWSNYSTHCWKDLLQNLPKKLSTQTSQENLVFLPDMWQYLLEQVGWL